MEPQWEHTATAPAWAPSLLGVKIPPSARNLLARESGFQDPVDELVFELDPAEAPRFLEQNHLQRGLAAAPEARDVPGLTAPPTAIELDGLSDDETDAGYILVFRRAQLWEWPGRAVIYLGAFST